MVGCCSPTSLGTLGTLLLIAGLPLWSVCVRFINLPAVDGLVVYGGL